MSEQDQKSPWPIIIAMCSFATATIAVAMRGSSVESLTFVKAIGVCFHPLVLFPILIGVVALFYGKFVIIVKKISEQINYSSPKKKCNSNKLYDASMEKLKNKLKEVRVKNEENYFKVFTMTDGTLVAIARQKRKHTISIGSRTINESDPKHGKFAKIADMKHNSRKRRR